MAIPANVPFPYDFFAPWAQVVLVVDGERFPLWFGDTGLENRGKKFKYEGRNLAILQEVSIEWQGAYHVITINLSPNYDDAIKLVDSDLIQQGYTVAEVTLGYRSGSGEPQAGGFGVQIFYGVVQEVDFSIGTEVSLTLKCVPGPIIGASEQQGFGQWKQEKIIDIIAKLWFRYKLLEGKEQPNIELELVKDGHEKECLDKKIDYSMGGKTDIAVIFELLRQCYCVALVQKGNLILVPISKAFSANASATFTLFSPRNIGGSTGIYPILSCSSSSKALFARGLRGRLAVGTDEKKKESVQVETGTEKDKNKPHPSPPALGPEASPGKKVGAGVEGARGAVPDADKGHGRSVGSQKDPNSEEDKNREGLKALNDYVNQGIQLEVESLCVPYVFPYTVVSVDGLGMKLDGNYFVTKVFHTINQDGGLTRWEGVNTGKYFSEFMTVRGLTASKVAPKDEAGSVKAHSASETPDLMRLLRRPPMAT